jgi:hypothetical protein
MGVLHFIWVINVFLLIEFFSPSKALPKYIGIIQDTKKESRDGKTAPTSLIDILRIKFVGAFSCSPAELNTPNIVFS